MDNQKIGEELSQLSRLLFDTASNKWYASIGLEIGAGVLATVLGLLELSGDWAFAGAVISTFLLIIAYVLRLQFDDQYDLAETMRRQAVMTEALGWPVGRVQLSQWRQKAGKKVRTNFKLKPRDPDFYTTQKAEGAERLAEMVIESAFYTRHLYINLRAWIWRLFVGAAFFSFLLVTITLTKAIPDSVDLVIARIVYSFVPIVLSINLFGWGLRLNRLISSICDVEEGLEELCGTSDMEVPQVMRLVAEYNCQVVSGFPIHNRLFDYWKDDINELWKQR